MTREQRPAWLMVQQTVNLSTAGGGGGNGSLYCVRYIEASSADERPRHRQLFISQADGSTVDCEPVTDVLLSKSKKKFQLGKSAVETLHKKSPYLGEVGRPGVVSEERVVACEWLTNKRFPKHKKVAVASHKLNG